MDFALRGKGAVIRGWRATHLRRNVGHTVCAPMCSPLEVRSRRMMERLNTGDGERAAEEIRIDDEAHSAIMRRHFGVRWAEPENYDLALNTERVSVAKCVEQVLGLVRSPQSGAGHPDERLALLEVAIAVPGVGDVIWRSQPESVSPKVQ